MSPSGMPTGSVSSRPPEVKGSESRGAGAADVDYVEESSGGTVANVEGIDQVGSTGRGGTATGDHATSDEPATHSDPAVDAEPVTPTEPATERGPDGPGGPGTGSPGTTPTTPSTDTVGPPQRPTADQDPATARIAELEAEISALRSDLVRQEEAREDLLARYESLLSRKNHRTSSDSGEPTAPRDSLVLKLARRLGLR